MRGSTRVGRIRGKQPRWHAFDFKPKKVGNVGRNTKFTPPLRAQYVTTIDKYAFSFRTLTAETLFDEDELGADEAAGKCMLENCEDYHECARLVRREFTE